MAKQIFKMSRDTSRAPAQIFTTIAGGIALLVILTAAWWLTYKITRPASWSGLNAALLVATSVVYPVLVERSLAMTPLYWKWRYRLAFILPVLVFCLTWITASAEAGFWVRAGLLLLVLLGIMAGSILTTGYRKPLWENNSPPSRQIQQEVYQRHLKLIGTPGATPASKRIFDVLLATSGMIISSPLWLAALFLIWFEDPGPVLFVKNSVGKGGINFHQYKFRTMVREAEINTGPILASDADERILMIGRVLRKSALDELPQLLNILKGEMSFVGPRPQRTVLVHGYLEKMPQYAQRHQVLPGLSGLAQVAGDYYLTPLQKLRFDRLYIRHASLGVDIKLLLLAFLVTFWYRWQPGWNGRLPRRLVRWGGS
jgi:lipopolysaccharide/colanic/teichoic acid biosynthesis glycosyltransferase